eukprot:scaffold288695_cov32-Tisochrysis_lutea.AAC.1
MPGALQTAATTALYSSSTNCPLAEPSDEQQPVHRVRIRRAGRRPSETSGHLLCQLRPYNPTCPRLAHDRDRALIRSDRCGERRRVVPSCAGSPKEGREAAVSAALPSGKDSNGWPT